jgi:methionine-rich copper-binding protein CopC
LLILAAKGMLAALVVVLALGASASGAGAHADYMRSDPAEGQALVHGPAEVIIWYSEGIDVNSSDAYVVDDAGKRWENPDEAAFHIHDDPTNPGLYMLPNLPNGSYRVEWDVLSGRDGHRTEGNFSFFVGTPPSGDSSIQPAATGDADNTSSSLPIIAASGAAAVLVVVGVVLYAVIRRRRGPERA